MASFQRLIFVQILFVSLNTVRAQATQILSFFPTGSVKHVQQVTVRFSDDMVAMGDPSIKVDPFTIICSPATEKKPPLHRRNSTHLETPKYTTRWADSRNWVLDFEKPLGTGIHCE